MARLVVRDDRLVVELSLGECVAACRAHLAVPVAAVTCVRVTDNPAREVRGVRSPGSHVPTVATFGTYRWSRLGRTLAAVRHGSSGVVVELDPAQADGWHRIVVSDSQAARTVASLRDALPVIG